MLSLHSCRQWYQGPQSAENEINHKATCSNCLHRCCWQWQCMGGRPSSQWLENKGISFLVVAGSKLKAKPYQYNHRSLCVSGMCYSSSSPQPACSHYLPASLWCSLDPSWAGLTSIQNWKKPHPNPEDKYVYFSAKLPPVRIEGFNQHQSERQRGAWNPPVPEITYFSSTSPVY